MRSPPPFFYFFFFNDTATTEIYTLSLHDALPISREKAIFWLGQQHSTENAAFLWALYAKLTEEDLKEKVIFSLSRSEEHTSELQSRLHLVCRLLLEKKKKKEKRAASTEETHRWTY